MSRTNKSSLPEGWRDVNSKHSLAVPPSTLCQSIHKKGVNYQAYEQFIVYVIDHITGLRYTEGKIIRETPPIFRILLRLKMMVSQFRTFDRKTNQIKYKKSPINLCIYKQQQKKNTQAGHTNLFIICSLWSNVLYFAWSTSGQNRVATNRVVSHYCLLWSA